MRDTKHLEKFAKERIEKEKEANLLQKYQEQAHNIFITIFLE